MTRAEQHARRARMVEAYRNGEAASVIAEREGVSTGLFYMAVREAGLSRGYQHRCVEAYRQCAAEGLNAAETAARLGVNNTTVHKAARKHGIAFARPLTRGELLAALAAARAAVG